MKTEKFARFEVNPSSISQLPENCGVYLLKDNHGEVIYVGKAKNIQKRAKAHLQNGSTLFKKELRERIALIQSILTKDENEALLLEEELIKTYKPPFNIRLKDDKSYPYLKFEREGDFPAVKMARKKTGGDGLYFGPFANSKKTKEGLKVLRSIFLLRSCSLDEKSFPVKRPCLDYEIGLCSAPCTGLISKGEYQKNLQNAFLFLNGDYQKVLKQLEQEMWHKAEKWEFEKAARYRNQIDAIKRIASRYRLVLGESTNADFVEMELSREDRLGSIVILKVRKGKLINSENFLATISNFETKEEVLIQFLDMYYSGQFLPPEEICLSSEYPEHVLELFGKETNLPFSVRKPQNEEEENLLSFAKENAVKNLNSERARILRREKAIQSSLSGLKEILRLNFYPEKIAGVDISNFQGSEAIGVVVIFEKGEPCKSEYRKFNMSRLKHPDDFSMIEETVGRYLKHTAKNNVKLPDLFLIDGGRGQLTSALKALKAQGQNIPVIAIAKENEEIYTTLQKEPIRLPVHSEALQLLQRVRNEAHRFAVTSHRIKRNKKLFHSILEEVKGIGQKRKRLILSTFDNLEEILNLDPQEISKKLGISKNLAWKLKEKIQEHFLKNSGNTELS